MRERLSNKTCPGNKKKSERPEYFESKVHMYDWAFRERYMNGGALSDEDWCFMQYFEKTSEYMDNYKERYDALKQAITEG